MSKTHNFLGHIVTYGDIETTVEMVLHLLKVQLFMLASEQWDDPDHPQQLLELVGDEDRARSLFQQFVLCQNVIGRLQSAAQLSDDELQKFREDLTVFRLLAPQIKALFKELSTKPIQIEHQAIDDDTINAARGALEGLASQAKHIDEMISGIQTAIDKHLPQKPPFGERGAS